MFYLLDTLPLFVAIAVYVPFWPGRFIKNEEEVYRPQGSVEEFPLAESLKVSKP